MPAATTTQSARRSHRPDRTSCSRRAWPSGTIPGEPCWWNSGRSDRSAMSREGTPYGWTTRRRNATTWPAGSGTRVAAWTHRAPTGWLSATSRTRGAGAQRGAVAAVDRVDVDDGVAALGLQESLCFRRQAESDAALHLGHAVL